MVELAPAPPNFIGPTWRKTVEGGWWLPDMTLGWGIINWLANYVRSPGGDHAGEPFMPTLEQARFILWWYAVDEDGRGDRGGITGSRPLGRAPKTVGRRVFQRD